MLDKKCAILKLDALAFKPQIPGSLFLSFLIFQSIALAADEFVEDVTIYYDIYRVGGIQVTSPSTSLFCGQASGVAQTFTVSFGDFPLLGLSGRANATQDAIGFIVTNIPPQNTTTSQN